MSYPSDKMPLRKSVLYRRRQMSGAERERASKRIFSHLTEWQPFREAKVIHTYLNQIEEVHTLPLVEYCWQQNKTVVVPYLHSGSRILGHSPLSELNHLTMGPYHIPEPLPEFRSAIELNSIDLILVPGVAFDKKGGRLGYGAGYYDRFLSQVDATLVGLAFQSQVLPPLSQAPHDVPMQHVVTESGVLF